MPPKAKPKAPPSDADVPVTSSIHRKTRKMPKNGETSDVESRPAKVGKKTRNQKMASSKTKDSDTGEISKAASSVPYEESDSRISSGTGSERGETPARELAHAEESWETHAMQSEALESSAYETAPPEEPRETPETDFTFPETPGAPDPKWKPRISLHAIPTLEPGSLTPRAGTSKPGRLFGSEPSVQVAGAQKASHVLPHPAASQYLHPMEDQCLNRRLNILNARISISRLEIEEMETEIAHIKEEYGLSVPEDKANLA